MGFVIVTIIGNLGSDPELRYLESGGAVTSFSVAVNHSKPNRQSGGWDEKTDWYRCSLFGKRGEQLVERLHKGSKVAISGRLETREFTGRDNQRHISLDVNVDNYQALDPRERESQGGGYDGYGGGYEEPASTPAPAPAGNASIDDLPF